MFFPPPPVIVNLPNPTPSHVPIPTDNIPKKKKLGWPIRVPKVIPPAKVPSRTKVPSKPSASPIPLHDKNSNNKRQPKDAPQKIKRSKKSNSTDTRGNNSPPVPPRAQSLPGRPSSYPTTPAGPSGSNRSRSRSPLIPNGQGSPLTRGPVNDNVQEEWVDEEDEENGGGRGLLGILTRYTLIPRTQFQAMCLNKPAI